MKEDIKDINIYEAGRLLSISILKLIVFIIDFFISKFLYFIIIILLGLAIGFGLYSLNKHYYRSDLIMTTNSVSSKEIILLFNDWDWRNDYSIPPEIKKEIKLMKATYLLDLNKDSIWDIVEDVNNKGNSNVRILNQRLRNSFAIIVHTYNPKILNKLQRIIIEHLENNKQIIKLNDIRIDRLFQTLIQVNKEMTYLDSMRTLEFDNVDKQSGTNINVSYAPTNSDHNDNLKLLSIKQKILIELDIKPSAINIIQNFQEPNSEVRSLMMILKTSGQISLLIAFIISIIVEIKQRKII